MGEILLSETPTEEQKTQLKEIEDQIITNATPLNFRADDTSNDIVVMERTFSVLVSLLESNGTVNPGALTTFDFYARLDYLNKKK